MKEKFTLIIETLHSDDMGDKENVSNQETNVINCSFSFLFFCFPFARCFFYVPNYKHKNQKHKTSFTDNAF